MIDAAPVDKKIVLMSQLFPEDFIITKLEEAIVKIKASKTKEAINELESTCALYLAKKAVEREGLDKTLDSLDKMHRGEELLTPRNN